MTGKTLRIALVVLNAFIALTAIGGGVGLLAGWLSMPLSWLQGTPFRSYTIPALILAIIVGGSGLVGATSMGIDRAMGVLASMVSGAIMMGWVAVEVALIGMTIWMQPFFFAVGLAVFLLAVRLWTVEMGHAGRPVAH